MDWLWKIDWQKMVVPESSILEMVIRGTIMFLAIYALLRVFRRQAGGVGIADILVIVLIADAGSNGMSGEGFSITESIVVVSTIVLWDWAFDWLGFKSKLIAKALEPEPLVLVKNGRMMRRNMESEMITEDELLAQLRQQGIEDIKQVKQCCLESSGDFSVIKMDGGRPKSIKKNKGASR